MDVNVRQPDIDREQHEGPSKKGRTHDNGTKLDQLMEKGKEMGLQFGSRFNTDDLLLQAPTELNGENVGKRYFYLESKSKGAGKDFLILRACYQTNAVSESSRLHVDDRKKFFKMAELVDTLTRTQRAMLGELLFLVSLSEKRHYEEKDGDRSEYVFPTLPTSDQELRSVFQGPKFSILKSLPRPEVVFYEKEQVAITSMEGCLRDILAQGVPVQGLKASVENLELVTFLSRHLGADETHLSIRYVFPVLTPRDKLLSRLLSSLLILLKAFKSR